MTVILNCPFMTALSSLDKSMGSMGSVKISCRGGGMAWGLRANNVLSEKPISIPSTHKDELTPLASTGAYVQYPLHP